MAETTQTTEPNIIISFLNGAIKEFSLKNMAKLNPDMLCRCIEYIRKGKYHRENFVNSLVHLLRYAPTVYKGTAWMQLQKTPLSHLTVIPNILGKTNSIKLRHAIATKIAKAGKSQILRAFFIAPENFRNLWTKLFIPRDKFHNKEIINQHYKNAVKLSQMSINEAIEEYDLTPNYLLKKLRIPIEKIMNLIEDEDQAIEFGRAMTPDNFFSHARWYRNIAGDEEFTKTAKEKVQTIKSPFKLLQNKKHLLVTNALTKELTIYIEDRAEALMQEMFEKFELDRIALIVDISGSMQIAVEITTGLYEAFSRTKVTDIIAFNHKPRVVTEEQLRALHCSGETAIGSAFVLLHGRISRKTTKAPQAILLISDMEENRTPYLSTVLPLLESYGNPPLIILWCGRNRRRITLGNYPHAYLPVEEFHSGLVMDIMKQIVSLTSKVVKEKEVTKILVERKPMEEILGAIELPKRYKESYRTGFLDRLLTETEAEIEMDIEMPLPDKLDITLELK